MNPKETSQGIAALSFARALMSGDYGMAHRMLSASLKHEYDESRLQTEYCEMIDYGDGPADFADVMEVLEDWPARATGDVGWAYVAISGPGYSEGIAVVVNREGDHEAIRQIEWGRP